MGLLPGLETYWTASFVLTLPTDGCSNCRSLYKFVMVYDFVSNFYSDHTWNCIAFQLLLLLEASFVVFIVYVSSCLFMTLITVTLKMIRKLLMNNTIVYTVQPFLKD